MGLNSTIQFELSLGAKVDGRYGSTKAYSRSGKIQLVRADVVLKVAFIGGCYGLSSCYGLRFRVAERDEVVAMGW